MVAATATSFGGWVFVGYPGLVYRDGLSAATIALVAVVIPLTGVLLLKRQWMLSRRFGYVTPAEMLADYFRGDAIRFFVLAVALVFAIPFLALQLGASGFLVSVVTDGAVSRDMAMWGLALVLLAYVTAGGLRAVACVASLQCLLLAAGMVIVGLIALDLAGGFGMLNEGLARLAGRRHRRSGHDAWLRRRRPRCLVRDSRRGPVDRGPRPRRRPRAGRGRA